MLDLVGFDLLRLAGDEDSGVSLQCDAPECLFSSPLGCYQRIIGYYPRSVRGYMDEDDIVGCDTIVDLLAVGRRHLDTEHPRPATPATVQGSSPAGPVIDGLGVEPTRYLDETPFDDPRGDRGYSVEINDDGLTVFSECCGSRMSEQTARVVHEALGRWLASRTATRP